MADESIDIEGDGLRFRAFTPDEAGFLWRRVKAYAAEADIKPTRQWRESFKRRVARSGAFHNGYLYLAVEEGGRLVGSVDIRRGSPMPDGVVEVGGEVFEDRDRGRGLGSRAAPVLFRYLFESGVVRIQATTPVGNKVARRVMEKFGFSYEGALRMYLPRPTGREDAAMYSLVRDTVHAAE